MTSRALTRAGLPPTSHIDLPAGPRPQYINEEGFEVDEEEQQVEDDLIEPIPAEEGNGDIDMAEDAIDEPDAEQVAEPLLSLAESLVVPFSLTQTRQRHLTHLLPHIFSHPPIPSHSKPRARVLPKSTFLFPTPPPPTQPLPIKEYHGHSRPSAKDTPGPSTEGQSPALSSSTVKAKSRVREKEEAVPAHEIECIARVTLSIGPISFPATELWVGRFVEPRIEGAKKTIRREKGERPKRPSVAGTPAVKRARMSGTPGTASPAPPPRPPQPAQYGIPRPSPPMPRPPTGPAAPTKSGIEPALIQRVNQAATQNPWLSIIIHKAARNQASKEELAKLGRVVARLGRGEGVGEGPLDGLTPAIGSSSASSRPPSVPGPSTVRPPQAASSTAPTVPLTAAKSDASSDLSEISDEEVDMTGPKQVGGGSLDPELIPETAKKPSTPISTTKQQTAALPSTTPAPKATASPTLSAQPPVFFTSGALPAGPSSTTSIPKTPSTSTHYTYGPPDPARPQSTPMPPPTPPPARRIYPLPAPFFVVAFKETPTEKFLLPLGSRSYISRVGGDHVTHPPPPPRPQPPVSPSATVVPPSVSETTVVPHTESPIAPVTPAIGSSVSDPNQKFRGRTRASLGRGAKEPKEEKEDKAATPEVTLVPQTSPIPEVMKEPIKSNLPTLPGMAPLPGTVLISTILPLSEWIKPDWAKLEKRLPFYSSEYDEKPDPVKLEPANSTNAHATPATSPSQPVSKKAKEPSSPVRSLRHVRTNSSSAARKDKHSMLNLAVEDFMPPESPVQAVTIRLEGLDDRAWYTVKRIMQIVESGEMKAISDDEPSLLDALPPANTAPVAPNPSLNPTLPPGPPPRPPFNPNLHPRLRAAYTESRKSLFERLLKRVRPRAFPKFRLPDYRSDLIDATTDRWAPRPYPLSTRPLYLTSPPPEGEDETVFYEPAPIAKKKKNQAEEEVMFELPVSFDQLDERVELGAKKSVSRKVGKLKMKKPEDPNKKRYGKRYVAGTICEGCAGEGLKVWRRGPGGRGTLCNPCGDKYLAGTLGELKAPGAASATAEDGNDDEKGPDGDAPPKGSDEVQVKEENKESAIAAAENANEGEGAIPSGDPIQVPTTDTAASTSMAVQDPSEQQNNDANRDSTSQSAVEDADQAMKEPSEV